MKNKCQLKRILAKSIRPIVKLTVSDWADFYRQLPSDSAEPGRWRTSRTPYLREIMNAFTDEGIHRVVVKSSAQIGKSEVLLNVVGRFAQLDPCSIMIIQPTLELAQDFSKSRLAKMIADTKSITPLFYEKLKSRDANQTILSKFFTGGRVVLTGANSPANLASRPIRILLCDEVDRFPPATKEGDPVDLASKRTTTHWNYKIGMFSTPTTEGSSRIDLEFKLGTQEIWCHQCPNCHEFHPLNYRDMQADFRELQDEAGNRAVIVNSVKWRCPDCGFEFDELQMKNSPQKYVAQNPDALTNGIRSFWVNGFSSPWLDWRNIMREWLEAKGDPNREAVVCNTRFGESYRLTGEITDESILLDRREKYGADLPDKVLLLTAGVDVQANRLEYEIAGWSAGFERFGIIRGVIGGEPAFPSTWQMLDEILEQEFSFSDGTSLKISRTFIDSGFATAHVYDYCKKRMARGRFAIKGMGGGGIPLLYRYTNPHGAGILLTILGVDDGKQEIMSRLNVTDGQAVMHFPLDDNLRRGYDADYFRQLISEHRVIRTKNGVTREVWETVTSGRRNEALDLAVYNLAAAKSCVGNNPETFWRSRHELLSDEKPVRKPRRKSRKFSQSDIWS